MAARGFNLLAYWMPAVALLCGTGLMTRWLLCRRAGAGTEPAPPTATGDRDARARRLHAQFEKELAAFDA